MVMNARAAAFASSRVPRKSWSSNLSSTATECTPPTTKATTAPAAGSASIAARNPARSPYCEWRCRVRQLSKGNVAVIKGAIQAGCRAFYGYPITPASEIAEAAALYIPEVGGTFVQAESEVSAINMVYGAASAGERAMTASSGPGLSLMQE